MRKRSMSMNMTVGIPSMTVGMGRKNMTRNLLRRKRSMRLKFLRDNIKVMLMVIAMDITNRDPLNLKPGTKLPNPNSKPIKENGEAIASIKKNLRKNSKDGARGKKNQPQLRVTERAKNNRLPQDRNQLVITKREGTVLIINRRSIMLIIMGITLIKLIKVMRSKAIIAIMGIMDTMGITLRSIKGITLIKATMPMTNIKLIIATMVITDTMPTKNTKPITTGIIMAITLIKPRNMATTATMDITPTKSTAITATITGTTKNPITANATTVTIRNITEERAIIIRATITPMRKNYDYE